MWFVHEIVYIRINTDLEHLVLISDVPVCVSNAE